MKDEVPDVQERLESELGIRIENNEVELPEDRTASECLTQVADFLLEKGYIQLDDLPISSGHKRNLMNTEPTHQNGDEMFRPKLISQDVYVETNYNREGIKRKIMSLVRFVSPK